MSDPVNPDHYKRHPSGVECIDVVEHMGFNLGNVVKYIWRADLKGQVPVEDLRKARWYLDREIAKREREANSSAAAIAQAGAQPLYTHGAYVRRRDGALERFLITEIRPASMMVRQVGGGQQEVATWAYRGEDAEGRARSCYEPDLEAAPAP